jgi:hypothetical protein
MLISTDSCDIDLCGMLPISTEGGRILVHRDLGHEFSSINYKSHAKLIYSYKCRKMSTPMHDGIVFL